MNITPIHQPQSIDLRSCIGVIRVRDSLRVFAPEYLGPDEAATLARIINREVRELKARDKWPSP